MHVSRLIIVVYCRIFQISCPLQCVIFAFCYQGCLALLYQYSILSLAKKKSNALLWNSKQRLHAHHLSSGNSMDNLFTVLSRELSRYDRDASFPEKKGYKPVVKIEYVDDSGRLLNSKEVQW